MIYWVTAAKQLRVTTTTSSLLVVMTGTGTAVLSIEADGHACLPAHMLVANAGLAGLSVSCSTNNEIFCYGSTAKFLKHLN